MSASAADGWQPLSGPVRRRLGVDWDAAFPRLAGCCEVAPGTIPLLLTEHVRARALTRELAVADRQGTAADRLRIMREIIDLLRAHVAKEDAMLLAVAVVLKP